jgi:hypothetical protein
MYFPQTQLVLCGHNYKATDTRIFLYLSRTYLEGKRFHANRYSYVTEGHQSRTGKFLLSVIWYLLFQKARAGKGYLLFVTGGNQSRARKCGLLFVIFYRKQPKQSHQMWSVICCLFQEEDRAEPRNVGCYLLDDTGSSQNKVCMTCALLSIFCDRRKTEQSLQLWSVICFL